MASYAEELTADRERLRRALSGLIQEQESTVRRIRDDLSVVRARLDRAVLKLVLFSQRFGRGSTDTTLVQREAEDLNTPLIELTKKLEREIGVLEMYRQRLAQVESGGDLTQADATVAGSIETPE